MFDFGFDVNPSSDDNDVADDDNEDDAVQSLLSGSTNLCDECAVSRSRQPICLPPSPPPPLLVSIGCPWVHLVSKNGVSSAAAVISLLKADCLFFSLPYDL